jgi:hypothetical protein
VCFKVGSKRKCYLTKNTKIISLATIAAVVAIVVIMVGRDMFIGQPHEFTCEDGPRRAIDIRDFATRYSAYSLELEATVKDKAKVSTKLAPIQLQQMSEALQNGQEFRKYVVAGYNSCAITKRQYGQYGTKFQALDNLAREINQLADSSSLSPEEGKTVATLITQYAELARKASEEPSSQPVNQVQQSTSGPDSPAVQGVQGDVTITMDESKGSADIKKPNPTSQ